MKTKKMCICFDGQNFFGTQTLRSRVNTSTKHTLDDWKRSPTEWAWADTLAWLRINKNERDWSHLGSQLASTLIMSWKLFKFLITIRKWGLFDWSIAWTQFPSVYTLMFDQRISRYVGPDMRSETPIEHKKLINFY